MSRLRPFHLAVPVCNLEQSREFYRDILGCKEGRSSEDWIDFDFFGHQLVCHMAGDKKAGSDVHNSVDGHQVPVPHFGVVLNMSEWKALRDQLIAKSMCFAIDPYIRFQGQVGEQATMFFYDPSGNALEFKGFNDIESELFANS